LIDDILTTDTSLCKDGVESEEKEMLANSEQASLPIS